MERGFMSRLLIVGVLLNSALALYAQAQQPNTAKLKADAQKVVSIIRGDKAKTQAYCQINSLGGEIDMAAQAKDEQKADALTKKINELEKQLGPEYLALFDALNDADQDSKDFQDILSMFDTLDQSCPR
jgi:DNA repair ATPase RecN